MFTAAKNLAAFAVSRLATLGLALGLPAVGAAQTITSFTPSTGTAGTTVVISGTGLGTTTSVLLNGLTLPITSKGATSVIVTIPAAASTGKLVVTTPTGNAVAGSQLGVTRSSSGTYFPQQTAKGSSFNNIKVASGAYSTPIVADLTGAGRADLLIGNGSGNIEYWAQSAANSTTYTKVGNLQAGGADIKTTNYAKPAVVDLDGDGLLDLLVGTGTGQRIARYEQTAAKGTAFALIGNLQASSGGDLTTGSNFPRPGVTDLDGDGLLDLLVGDASGNLKRFEASAVNAATFVSYGNLQADGADIAASGGTAKPLVFDLDGNGLLDFIVGSQNGIVTRFEQTARYATTFTSKGNLTTDNSTAISMGTSGNNEGGYSAPTITDIDGNGRLDLLVGNATGTIYRYEQVQQAALTASPLPVVLVSFSGQAASTGNQLSWATASELNSAYFGVERSADGVDFSQVARVAAAGNSASARSYQYLDAAAPTGTSYYRLRQVDQDGTTTYSPVVALSRASALGLAKAQVFPTVFETELSVFLPEATATQAATVALLTADGRPVYSQAVQLSATPQALGTLPALAPGVYLLRVATAAGATTQRVVRQ